MSVLSNRSINVEREEVFNTRSLLNLLQHGLLYSIVPITIFLLWWVASNQEWMPTQILPTPQQVWATFLELILKQDLLANITISLERLAIGSVLGILGGIIFGGFLGSSQKFECYSSASFFAIAIIPTLAWLPLLMMWLGIEESLKYFLIFKAVFIPIAIHVQTGLKEQQAKLKEVTNVLGMSYAQQFKKLILPSVLPYFFTGLRIAIAAGWTTLVAVELIASSEGIGYLMVTGRQLFQLDIVFVMIFVIATVGVLIDLLIAKLERRWVFWPHATLTVQPQKDPTQPFLQPWVLPAFVLLFWWLATSKAWISIELLPSPQDVFQSLITELQHGGLFTATVASLVRALQGLFYGACFGVGLGILVGRSEKFSQLFEPSINTLRLIAIFAWIPLLTAWFGLGNLSKTIFIALATFFPMFVATSQATKNLSKQLIEVSDVLRFSLLQRSFKLILPSITPSIFSGLRLALLYAWMASFGAEYLMGSGVGIGTYMMTAQQSFEMDRVVAATILVASLGVVLAYLGQYFENKATSWRKNKG